MTEADSTKKKSSLILALVFLSFWSVWQWYLERLFDKSDEPFGALALLALTVLLATKKEKSSVNSYFAGLAIAAYLAYIGSFFFVSKLASALIAVLCCAATISWLVCPLNIAEWTLTFLSLPLVASLNFYLGYPLRSLVAKVSSIMLAVGNIAATPEGTLLKYNDHLVHVDAPCSGIKMLWFALFTTAFLCSLLKLSSRSTFLLLGSASLCAVLANALRVTSLFYIETGLIDLPFQDDFLHQAIGLVLFGLLLGAIIVQVRLFQKSSKQTSMSPQNTNKTLGNSALLVSALAVMTLILPLIGISVESTQEPRLNHQVVVWPKKLDGEELKPVTMPEKYQGFARNFPGEIKIFETENKLYIIRWIEKPTRKLHPACDCYRGAGYEITWLPLVLDKEGRSWRSFRADKGSEHILVRERIADLEENQWSEPSSWYWSALLGETKPPWWGITVEERLF